MKKEKKEGMRRKESKENKKKKSFKNWIFRKPIFYLLKMRKPIENSKTHFFLVKNPKFLYF